ncbi:hypothetical protein RIF29_28893 [Crotalaria pallida]|uniref:Uncharacterized protein n=1 Tax=Crotalaria pallida TaxID=3830 RepID=A0AAN9EK80_CROPI
MRNMLERDRVEESELHPLVAGEIGNIQSHQLIEGADGAEPRTVMDNSQHSGSQKDGEWKTVMTRRKAAQLKKDGAGVINKGDDGEIPKFSNG